MLRIFTIAGASKAMDSESPTQIEYTDESTGKTRFIGSDVFVSSGTIAFRIAGDDAVFQPAADIIDITFCNGFHGVVNLVNDTTTFSQRFDIDNAFTARLSGEGFFPALEIVT